MGSDRSRMEDHPRRWPWIVAAVTLAAFLFACLFYPDIRRGPLFISIFGPIVAAFVVVGALMTSRVRTNVIGPMLLAAGIALAVTIAAGSFAFATRTNPGVPVELQAVALIVNEIGFIIPIVIVLIGVPLIFPDGRLLSPRWRWVLVLVAAALGAFVVSQVLAPGPINESDVMNPFTSPDMETLSGALETFSNGSAIVGFVAALLALVLRYRRGDAIQRQQVKWLVAVASVAGVAFPVAFVAPTSVVTDVAFLIGLVAMFALPVAIAVAVLRYHLYEIDRIISRTIAWAVITGVLAAAFVVLVVGLEALLQGQTQGETLAVAASTLAAFGLFQPLRRRVQTAVDRRFDRARYDAQRTADAFAERLRDEVELDALAVELQRTVEAAIRPSVAALWLPERDAAG
jgi:MFS family permease